MMERYQDDYFKQSAVCTDFRDIVKAHRETQAHVKTEARALKVLTSDDLDVVTTVPDYLIEAFPKRIVNVHPALLPKFGGKGMWGHHVHEAVKAAGETVTGMTVHYVSPVCDGGEIIAQFKTELAPGDTVDDIAAKEHVLEMEHFPQVIQEVIEKTF